MKILLATSIALLASINANAEYKTIGVVNGFVYNQVLQKAVPTSLKVGVEDTGIIVLSQRLLTSETLITLGNSGELSAGFKKVLAWLRIAKVRKEVLVKDAFTQPGKANRIIITAISQKGAKLQGVQISLVDAKYWARDGKITISTIEAQKMLSFIGRSKKEAAKLKRLIKTNSKIYK